MPVASHTHHTALTVAPRARWPDLLATPLPPTPTNVQRPSVCKNYPLRGVTSVKHVSGVVGRSVDAFKASWGGPGGFLEASQGCSGGVLEASWRPLGGLLEASWGLLPGLFGLRAAF